MCAWILLSILVPPLVIGADAPYPVLDHYTHIIDGQLEPGAVPMWRKMDALLERYPNELKEQLEDRDHRMLLVLKKEREWLGMAQDVLGIVRGRQAACLVANKAEYVDDAVRFETLAEQDKGRLYSDFLKMISETGRAAIDDYVDRKIAPAVKYEQTDWRAFVEAMPMRESDHRRLQEECSRPLEWRAVVELEASEGAFVVKRAIK